MFFFLFLEFVGWWCITKKIRKKYIWLTRKNNSYRRIIMYILTFESAAYTCTHLHCIDYVYLSNENLISCNVNILKNIYIISERFHSSIGKVHEIFLIKIWLLHRIIKAYKNNHILLIFIKDIDSVQVICFSIPIFVI